jgi:hypothetical protein
MSLRQAEATPDAAARSVIGASSEVRRIVDAPVGGNIGAAAVNARCTRLDRDRILRRVDLHTMVVTAPGRRTCG